MSNKENFVNDMSLWPPLEYRHIYCYFVQRLGVRIYTAGAPEMEKAGQLFPEWLRSGSEALVCN